MAEVSASSVTEAWKQAVDLAQSSTRKEVTNLIVNICGLDGDAKREDAQLRDAYDAALSENGKYSIATVANTIFPASLWNPKAPRQALYERYLRLWPRIHSCRQNRRGTYFQRMIHYPRPGDASFNQLEHVISAYNSGIHRRSTLQCGILVPFLDLNPTPYQGFPCMQQVAFMPEAENTLRVTALYPTQYLWARAYGNYLGLIGLGRFMASEMGLRLTTITCVSLAAKLDEPGLARRIMGGGV